MQKRFSILAGDVDHVAFAEGALWVVSTTTIMGAISARRIDSALQQSYPYVEVIVVDDGSTDASLAIILSYNDRMIPILQANGGQAAAFNAGFARSRGDVVIFLDSDDMCCRIRPDA